MCHIFVTIPKKCRNQFVKIRHFIMGTCPKGFDKNTWLMHTVQDMEIYIKMLHRLHIRTSMIHKKLEIVPISRHHFHLCPPLKKIDTFQMKAIQTVLSLQIKNHFGCWIGPITSMFSYASYYSPTWSTSQGIFFTNLFFTHLGLTLFCRSPPGTIR